MATSILLKFLTLKWNISRTICRIEVGDGSLFCIFHTLSFELNYFFRPEVPFKAAILLYQSSLEHNNFVNLKETQLFYLVIKVTKPFTVLMACIR